MTVTSHSAEETKQIARDFANTLKGGEVIFLEGDLGSGKTTFVQGLVSAFSPDAEVHSPTFTLVNVYPVDHEHIKRIVHADLYRLKNASELKALTIEEYLDEQTVLLIEWPELLEPSLKNRYHSIKFQDTKDGRQLTF